MPGLAKANGVQTPGGIAGADSGWAELVQGVEFGRFEQAQPSNAHEQTVAPCSLRLDVYNSSPQVYERPGWF
jgi:hypothetical protein